MTAAVKPVTLTAADRCDRCGARAHAIAVLPSTLRLAFCAHHYREHWEALLLADAEVTQTTPRPDEH